MKNRSYHNVNAVRHVDSDQVTFVLSISIPRLLGRHNTYSKVFTHTHARTHAHIEVDCSINTIYKDILSHLFIHEYVER